MPIVMGTIVQGPFVLATFDQSRNISAVTYPTLYLVRTELSENEPVTCKNLTYSPKNTGKK